MNIHELEEIFKQAKDYDFDVAIELTVPTRTATEIIIIKHDNLDYKLGYYKANYTEQLELVRCPEIKIVNAETIKWEDK